MKHYTPFTVHEGTRCYTIKDLRGAVVAEMPAARASDYDLALQFAAAPELLEALRALTDRVDPGNKGRDLGITSLVNALKAARAAIAKAERGE
jgi:hypothetical protein